MCCFAAYLADSGLAPQTVKVYLAAVRRVLPKKINERRNGSGTVRHAIRG